MTNKKTSVNKTLGLDNWTFDANFPASGRFAEVSIHLEYIDINSISHLEPKERKKRIREDQKQKFHKLIHTNLFNEYEIIGTSSKPRGIKARISFHILNTIEKLDFIDSIFIIKIDGAKKKRAKKASSGFYCVKMTVVIEIEGG